MKKLIFLFSLGVAVFSCQKNNILEEQAVPNETQAIESRSCALEITPLTGSGDAWYASVYVSGVGVVARICGPAYNNPNYTKVNWNEVFTVPNGNAYKKYRIVIENLNVTFNIHSDAGCFDLQGYDGGSYSFYAGCDTGNCLSTIKVNSTTNSLGWLAEVRRINADCTEELVTTIGGGASGSDLFIPTGGTLSLNVDGFKLVSIKQLIGNVNYTLGAPSAAYAPMLPSPTFTVNAGTTTSRRLGCSN